MNREFIEALEQISKEKDLNPDIIIEAVETSLATACRKNFGQTHQVDVVISRETGEIKVYAKKEVKEAIEDEQTDILIEEAKKYKSRPKLGDIVLIEVTPKDFGRVAAQTAKQVVMQKLREAERENMFSEFSTKESELANGVIQKVTPAGIYINLGKAEALMLPKDQVPTEQYDVNKRIKVLITEVSQTTKGPQILVSRSSGDFVKRLFEQEIPEIFDGIIEIKKIVREPGSKTKIAVISHDKDVDPMGACVGKNSQRINMILNELEGEKIDIVLWNKELSEFIKSAISPAKVVDVRISDDEKLAEVIVGSKELSLAIGKSGQNARMAAKLVGCKIDIKANEEE